MSKGNRAKLSTDLGSKASSVTPIENRRRLAARISKRLGISEETALNRITHFPRFIDNAGGVLFQKQKPFVDALLDAVESLDPCYRAICDDIRSKIAYVGRKKIQRFSTWITMAMAGMPVFLGNAYDGPGMYMLKKVEGETPDGEEAEELGAEGPYYGDDDDE